MSPNHITRLIGQGTTGEYELHFRDGSVEKGSLDAMWCGTAYVRLTASDEPAIHELQHLHWNCFLVKILALEPTAKRNFFGNAGDARIFDSNDSDIFAARFVPNNIPDLKIGVH
jgi:hypothetical protein